jgi:hypothetical protein
MSDWHIRLVEEHNELKAKTRQLSFFLKDNAAGLTELDRGLLGIQLSAMQTYLAILVIRMDRALEEDHNALIDDPWQTLMPFDKNEG